MEFAGLTHVGNHRIENQDAFFVYKNKFAVVCDGMGGHDDGAKAAEIASMTASRYISKKAEELTEDNLFDLMIAADEAIKSLQPQGGSLLQRMGTTIVCLYKTKDGGIIYGWTGDSFLLAVDKAGKLHELTEPHTYITGGLQHVLGHLEHQNRGPEIKTISKKELEEFDWLILCSDGLTDYLPKELIEEQFINAGTPEEVSQKLLDKTLNGTAGDNITIVAVKP